MMKNIIFLLILYFAIAMQAQAQKIIPNETIELGKITYAFQISDNKEKALVFFSDSVSKKRSKIMVGLFDFNKNNFDWTKECANKIPYWRIIQGQQVYKESRITKYGALLVDKGHCKLITNDGNTLWDVKLEFAYANEKQDLLLGYANMTSNKLIAYRLSDGQKLWEHKVSHSKCWGWDNMLIANDTLMIVPADDLYFINPTNGNVIAYETQNAFQRVGNMLLKAIVAGAALGTVGIVTGSSVYPVYIPQVYSEDVVTATCSNVYPMNGKYYFTDRDRLSCLNANGDTTWTYEFPSRIMGKAKITGDGKRVTVINYGYGLKGGYERFACGKPFIASFDAATGKNIYFNSLSDNKDMLADAYVDDNNAFLIYPTLIIHKRLDEPEAKAAEWNTQAYGDLTTIPSDTVYTYRLNDETLTPLYCDSTHCIVITDTGAMKVVDSSLKIIDDYQASNLYYKICGNDSLSLVTNKTEDEEGKFFIIKNNGEPIGSIDYKVKDAQRSGNNIYVLSDKQILKIDLGNIRTE